VETRSATSWGLFAGTSSTCTRPLTVSIVLSCRFAFSPFSETWLRVIFRDDEFDPRKAGVGFGGFVDEALVRCQHLTIMLVWAHFVVVNKVWCQDVDGVTLRGGRRYRWLCCVRRRIMKQRGNIVGRVTAAGCIAKERKRTNSRVSLPLVLLKSALTPVAVLLSPVVLFWSATSPVAVLPLPVVLLASAKDPVAVFQKPVVLFRSAPSPVAVFSSPVVLLSSARVPTAVLKLPVVLLVRALKPSAVFHTPPVRLNSAPSPSAVFALG
jgi:hypothetical protein